MTEQEREDKQIQAEILERIDALEHKAQHRRRVIGGTAGGVLAVALLLVTLRVGNRPAEQSLLIAQTDEPAAVKNAEQSMDAVIAEPVVVAQNSGYRKAQIRLTEPAEIVTTEPKQEAPVEAKAEPIAIAVEEVAEAPVAESAQTEAPAPQLALSPSEQVLNQERKTYQPKVYTASRWGRVKQLFAFGSDPNMDGTNLSINLI